MMKKKIPSLFVRLFAFDDDVCDAMRECFGLTLPVCIAL